MLFSFGHFGSAVPAVSLPKIFPSPSLLVRGEMLERRAAAVPVLLSTGQNRGVLPTSFCPPKQSTALEGAAGGKMNFSPRLNIRFYSYTISVLSVYTLDFIMMTCNPENRHLLLRSPDTRLFDRQMERI